MAYQAIRVEKLTPIIGAEVLGVDLSQPLDERTFKRSTKRSPRTR